VQQILAGNMIASDVLHQALAGRAVSTDLRRPAGSSSSTRR